MQHSDSEKTPSDKSGFIQLLFYIGCGCLAYSPALAIIFEHFELLSLLYLFPYVVTFQLLYANRHSIFSS